MAIETIALTPAEGGSNGLSTMLDAAEQLNNGAAPPSLAGRSRFLMPWLGASFVGTTTARRAY